MPPDIAKLILDMQFASDRIERFVSGKTFDDYVADEMLRSAVERQFEIIGEAMTRLIRLDRAVAERLTDFRKIAGFRNALVHGYDSIDNALSWGIISQKLSVLRSQLRGLMNE